MARKRALKKRADYRGGGYVSREGYQFGGLAGVSRATPISQATKKKAVGPTEEEKKKAQEAQKQSMASMRKEVRKDAARQQYLDEGISRTRADNRAARTKETVGLDAATGGETAKAIPLRPMTEEEKEAVAQGSANRAAQAAQLTEAVGTGRTGQVAQSAQADPTAQVDQPQVATTTTQAAQAAQDAQDAQADPTAVDDGLRVIPDEQRDRPPTAGQINRTERERLDGLRDAATGRQRTAYARQIEALDIAFNAMSPEERSYRQPPPPGAGEGGEDEETVWPDDPGEGGEDGVSIPEDPTTDRTTTAVLRPGQTQPDVITVQGGQEPPDIPVSELTVEGEEGGLTPEEKIQQIEEQDKLERPDDVVVTEVGTTEADLTEAEKQAKIDAATYDAVKAGEVGPTEAATREVTREAEAAKAALTETKAAERDPEQEKAAEAEIVKFERSLESEIDEVTGEPIRVEPTKEAEINKREIITGVPHTGEAQQIIDTFGFGASKNRVLRGPEAKQAASSKLTEDYDLPQDIADRIVQDVPELVTNMDGLPQESIGAVAALPEEALVTSQMESLLAGMEEGKTPAWARPAVAAIEAQMAERGLSISSVGRDALFNSIIQSALPLAQSNAQALQQRASQNLSNEQQALIQDREIAARFIEKNADFRQQMELANLSNEQQMELANLSSKNQAASENLTAAQQTDLANLNTRMQTNLLQANIASQMGLAQLSVDQERAVKNAATRANIDMAKFSAAQQTELVNSKFAQTMTQADFNARQQGVMQDATTLAAMDMQAADARTKVSIQNAQNFLQMDMANLNNEQQGIILDQQMKQQRMLSDQAAANAAEQFNSTSENQTNQFMASLGQQAEMFNATQANAMEQFNATEANRAEALNAQNKSEADKFNNQLSTQIAQYDSQIEFQREQWNAQNAQAVEQSNINWRRKANTINTAAENAANQQGAQFAFNMSAAEQNFVWQSLRDDAAFSQQSNLAQREQAMQLLSSIYGNSELMGGKHSKFDRVSGTITNLYDLLFGAGALEA